jgi:hypothetical protein
MQYNHPIEQQYFSPSHILSRSYSLIYIYMNSTTKTVTYLASQKDVGI